VVTLTVCRIVGNRPLPCTRTAKKHSLLVVLSSARPAIQFKLSGHPKNLWTTLSTSDPKLIEALAGEARHSEYRLSLRFLLTSPVGSAKLV